MGRKGGRKEDSGSEDTSEMYSSASEEKGNLKARSQGHLTDPFKKRVPDSFYEREKRLLGVLPRSYEIGYTAANKPYYVDNESKTTSWIDPRTEKTRSKDVMRCKMGELPYGWEEEIDKDVGVYYIDHNTHSTFLDPPWDPRVQNQVYQLESFLAEQLVEYKRRMDDVRHEATVVEEIKEKEIRALIEEKERLLEELRELKQKVSGMSENDYQRYAEPDLEGVDMPKTVEEFQDRLRDLVRLQEALTSSGHIDELEEYKNTKMEINKVQRMLEEEERVRDRILREIENLKGQMENEYSGSSRSPGANYMGSPDGEYHLSPQQTFTSQEVASNPDREPHLSRKTRYEMEMELLMLKKRLKAEKLQNATLSNLQQEAQNASEGSLPVWIKKIDDIASSSRTLRVKIAQKQKSSPEQMSFRERMLFFAASAIDNKH